MEYSKKNVLEEKCMDFSVKVVKLYRWINKTKKEYKLSDQMMRAGTAIGASYGEAQYSESDGDYVHKLKIAMKECHEVIYWLELMQKADIITEEQYGQMYEAANEIQVMMTSCVKKVNDRQEKKGKIEEKGMRIKEKGLSIEEKGLRNEEVENQK